MGTIKWLVNAPILAFPDFDKPCIIQGDASTKAIGGACLQGNSEQILTKRIISIRVISLRSKVRSEVEKRWPIMDRELLSLVYGFKQSKHFCWDRHVVFGH
jgi:hypothetical protein